MTLAEIISSISWPQLKAALLWLQNDIEPDLREYQKVLRSLQTIAPIADKMRICIEKRPAHETDAIDAVEVVGRDGTLNRELDDFRHLGARATEVYGAEEVVWSLCLRPWASWLGMEIANETLRSLSPAQVAAHCLYEMTFHGFLESDIKDFSAELDRRVAEVDAMTEDEKKSHFVSLDEVIARISSRLEETP